MKKSLFIIAMLITYSLVNAQESDIEKEFKILEDKAAKAVLEKDTVALAKIWSKDFTVNTPMNQIERAGKYISDRRVIKVLNYSSYEKEVELVIDKGNVVIVMGNETIVDKGKDGTEGRTIKRRYTNIWMKEGNDWRLTARQASEICN